MKEIEVEVRYVLGPFMTEVMFQKGSCYRSSFGERAGCEDAKNQ